MRTPQERDIMDFRGSCLQREAPLGHLTSHFTVMVKWPIDTLCSTTSPPDKRRFPFTGGPWTAATSPNLRSYLSSSFLIYKMRKTIKVTSQCLWRWNETLKRRSPWYQGHSIWGMPFSVFHLSNYLFGRTCSCLSPALVPPLTNLDWKVSWRGQRWPLSVMSSLELVNPGTAQPLCPFCWEEVLLFFLDFEAEGWYHDGLPQWPC